MKKDYDVIIIGGGMVGASLARSLAGCGLEIAVVEAWPLRSGRQPSYDDRAIALAYGSRLILQGMGAWSALEADVEPIRRIHVSDRGHFGFSRLDAREQGVDALGYVVTAQRLGQALMQDLDRLSKVAFFCPASLQSFEVTMEAVRVRVAMDGEQQTLRGRLLVAADGNRSLVREGLGIEVR